MGTHGAMVLVANKLHTPYMTIEGCHTRVSGSPASLLHACVSVTLFPDDVPGALGTQ